MVGQAVHHSQSHVSRSVSHPATQEAERENHMAVETLLADRRTIIDDGIERIVSERHEAIAEGKVPPYEFKQNQERDDRNH
jgi:hypothetical protein